MGVGLLNPRKVEVSESVLISGIDKEPTFEFLFLDSETYAAPIFTA